MQNPFRVLFASFVQFRDHWAKYIAIFLPPGLLGLSLTLMLTYQTEIQGRAEIQFTPPLIAMFAAVIFTNILMSIALMYAARDVRMSFNAAYSATIRIFIPYFLLSLLLFAFVLVAAGIGIFAFIVSGFYGLGILAFIVPAVILMVWFAFATFALVFECAGVIDSLKRSCELVRGRWWAVLGRILVMLLLFILIDFIYQIALAINNSWVGLITSEAIYFIASAIATPVAIIYFYQIFMDLVRASVGAAEPVTDTPTPAAPGTPREAM